MYYQGTLHRKLSILLSPEKEFYTPTYEGYSLAESEPKVLASMFTGKKLYFFQRVIPTTRSILWGLRKSLVWEATDRTLTFDDFPKDWVILEGRAFNTPKKISPLEAQDLQRLRK